MSASKRKRMPKYNTGNFSSIYYSVDDNEECITSERKIMCNWGKKLNLFMTFYFP